MNWWSLSEALNGTLPTRLPLSYDTNHLCAIPRAGSEKSSWRMQSCSAWVRNLHVRVCARVCLCVFLHVCVRASVIRTNLVPDFVT
jgi:hypothetical protein